jgi:tetratricopeptide (TPR) repeat protein
MRLFIRGLVAAIAIFVGVTPAAAEWHEAKSKHFVIYADMQPARLKEFAERLEKFDKAVRVARGMDDPELTDSNRLTVYTLSNQAAIGRLVGSSTVAGLYAARATGSVAFVPRSAGGTSDPFELNAETIFFHEYAHHILLQNVTIALPSWVTEGFAEFFSTAKIERDGSVLIGSPANHRAYNVFSSSGLKLEDMVGGTYRKLGPEAGAVLYARGWLLTHFLTFKDDRKDQLTRYVDAIQHGQPALMAAKAAFGDLKRLDRELDAYARGRFVGVRVPAASIPIDPVQIRRMTSGESAIMKVRIRSKYGVNVKTAPGVAADARKIAVQYPGDAFVQATLAEAEYDAGQYPAAEAAADRALAVNPDDVHALIYKGRVQVETAKADSAKANWPAIRKWFQRANQLDTENAEPLMLFHKSFADAGVEPTPNATEALLYALDLVPQDRNLRINAVRQMLQESRLDEAKTLFAPLAFDPHANEDWRARCARIIAAIDRKDGKAALEALDAPDAAES